jgi:Domain of unknown function (DUF427)
MVINVYVKNGSKLASGELGKTVIGAEGNYYFDRSVVDFFHLMMKGEGQQYTCPIKRGTCDYYNLVDDAGNIVEDEIGWIYESVENSLFKGVEHKIAFYKNKSLRFEEV